MAAIIAVAVIVRFIVFVAVRKKQSESELDRSFLMELDQSGRDVI
jgi:hypothetical protein